MDINNVNNYLKQINDYFKDKIIQGDFQFNSCNENTANITIDNQFTFELWIANEPKYHFNFHDLSLHYKTTQIFVFETQEEKLKGYKALKPYIEEHINKKLLKDYEKKVKDLKRKIN